jgi:FkbM family methyltransferase
MRRTWRSGAVYAGFVLVFVLVRSLAHGPGLTEREPFLVRRAVHPSGPTPPSRYSFARHATPLLAPRPLAALMSRTTRFTRHLRDIVRVHVEGRILRLLLQPDLAIRHVPTATVADTILPRDLIGPEWICHCVGVGEDIRIDRWLTEARGAQVWAFDPTPRAVRYMETAEYDRGRLHFRPVGVWSEDTVLRFYAPPNPAWVSHSVMAQQGGEGYFDAPCRSLPSLMRELGHDRVDLLKLNIEGAEHLVLEAMLAAQVHPRVITLTYEGDDAFRKAVRWTQRLRGEGYHLFARTGWFFTYLHQTSIP